MCSLSTLAHAFLAGLKGIAHLFLALLALAGSLSLLFAFDGDADAGNNSPRIPEPIYRVDVDPLDQQAILLTRRELLVRDLATGRLIREFSAPTGSLTAVRWIPGSSRFLVGHRDGRLRIVDARRQKTVNLPHVHRGAVGAIAVSQNGRRAAVGSYDRLCLWDLIEHRVIAQSPRVGDVHGVQFSHDQDRLVLAGHEGTLQIFRAADLRLEQQFPLGGGSVLNAMFFDEDRKILAATRNSLWVVCLETGSIQSRPIPRTPYGNELRKLALSPNERWVAVGDSSSSVTIYARADLQPLGRLSGHDAPASCLTFSANGDRLYSSSFDGTMRVWDVNSRREIDQLAGVPFDERE